MKIEIRCRLTGRILLSGEYGSIKECLEKNSGADLSGANLSDANLSGAYLRCADLSYANLRDAKGYSESHYFFTELIKRQKIDKFIEVEWSAIGQIIGHMPCWETIKKRYGKTMLNVFKVLKDSGFGEYYDKYVLMFDDDKTSGGRMKIGELTLRQIKKYIEGCSENKCESCDLIDIGCAYFVDIDLEKETDI